MFRSLRWRLTFWFVLLTSIVYAVTVASGLWLFRAEMTRLVDEELTDLADELRPSIVIKNNVPSLEEWSMKPRRVPFKFTQTIQIYDPRGKLLEQHGPHGIPILYLNEHEIKDPLYHARVYATPLFDGKKLIGYIQIELSLKNIERSANQFGQTMAILAPFLLLGLGAAGFVFSGKAAKPVEEGFHVLQRFMTDAGHELSTPIAIIQANAEAMEAELPDLDDSSKGRLPVIYRSIDRMSNLVQDLMLLSKMESPVSQKNLAHQLEMSRLVGHAVEEMQELFKTKSIELKAENLAQVNLSGDADSLKRVITNLLQNALRYTDEGGVVRVGLDNLGRHAKLTVSDTGIGIPPDSLPLIFDRFYRVDKSRSRAQGGSGLGLSIVKAIIEAHKGRIDVESKLGTGTTFTVLLPSGPRPLTLLPS
jgi:signal transduction histidine kinase